MTEKLVDIFHFIIVTVAISVLCGCGNDDSVMCEDSRVGESYNLSDEGLEYVDPYIGIDRLVFTTGVDEEVVFELSFIETIGSYSRGGVCEDDPTEGQTVNGSSQLIEIELSNVLEFDESIVLSLYETPDTESIENQETFAITYGNLFDGDFSEGDELFFYQLDQANPQVQFLDSLEINGTVFYSLYQMNATSTVPKLEVLYTLSEGLVYIWDFHNQKEYFYDRKE